MSDVKNSAYSLVKYFSVEGNPVKLPEFKRFWDSLTEVEKDYYRHVYLRTGLLAA